jgi:integrase/recombinase XerC
MRYLETDLGPHIAAYLRWYRAANPAPLTVDSKERELARLAVKLPAGVGIEASMEDLLLVLDAIKPASWRKVRSHWKTFFDWAIETDRRVAKNPVTRLPKLLNQDKVRVLKTFTETERNLLVNAARFTDDPYRDKARVMLMLDSGFRKAELRGLRVGDINPNERIVTVIGKGDKEREVPLYGDFWLAWEQALLEELPRIGRQYRPDDYVWFGMRIAGEYMNRERQVIGVYPDRPMGQRGFHDWWVRLISHTDIPYRKPHMTRHTYATAALDASEGDIYGVSQLLGHASTKTTEAYLHSSQRRKESVARKLAAARRGNRNEHL